MNNFWSSRPRVVHRLNQWEHQHPFLHIKLEAELRKAEKEYTFYLSKWSDDGDDFLIRRASEIWERLEATLSPPLEFRSELLQRVENFWETVVRRSHELEKSCSVGDSIKVTLDGEGNLNKELTQAANDTLHVFFVCTEFHPRGEAGVEWSYAAAGLFKKIEFEKLRFSKEDLAALDTSTLCAIERCLMKAWRDLHQ